MSKRIAVISFLLALGSAAPALAEPKPARRITGGPVVGLNIAGLGGGAAIDLFGMPLDPELAGRERLAAGAFAELRVAARFAVRAELLYSLKGAASDGADPSDPTAFYELRYSSSYLAIPVLATYRFDYDGEFTPRLFAGPEIALRLGSDVSAFAGATGPMGTPQTVELDADLEHDSARVDLGVVVGVGMGMPVGSGSLVLDIRYTQGITHAIDDHEITPTQGVTLHGDAMRNHVFALIASYEI